MRQKFITSRDRVGDERQCSLSILVVNLRRVNFRSMALFAIAFLARGTFPSGSRGGCTRAASSRCCCTVASSGASRPRTPRFFATGTTSVFARCAGSPCAKHGESLTRALPCEPHIALDRPRRTHDQEPRTQKAHVAVGGGWKLPKSETITSDIGICIFFA